MNNQSAATKTGRKPAGHPPVQRFRPGTIKRLLFYMSEYRFRLILIGICILISAAASAASALFLQTLIDQYIVPLLGQVNPDFSGLFRAVLSIGCICLIGICSTLFYNWVMAIVEQDTLKKIRGSTFTHIQSLPIRYFDTRPYSDVMGRYTNDINMLRQAISQSFPQMLSSVVSIAAVFFSVLCLNMGLTTSVAVFAVLLLKVIKTLVGRSGMLFVKQRQALGNVNGYTEGMINGQKVVKVFCHEDKTKEGFDLRNDKLHYCATEANKYGDITMPVVDNMGCMLYILLVVIDGTAEITDLPSLSLARVNTLTTGTIVSFLTLSRGFINPIGQISMQFNIVIMALAGASRIFELMDEENGQDDRYVTLMSACITGGVVTGCNERTEMWAWKYPHSDDSIAYTPLNGDIHFYDVDFKYGEDKLVLHNITLYAEPGQKVAFVRATGASKATVTSLINRFYDIVDGKIRYDDISINKIKKTDLRHSLDTVLQDVNLFTDAVMENIRYDRLDATDKECIAVARLANADSFIRMLPKRYQTMLKGDGSGLSQGQRQLISIMHAAVADPPMMILDEATFPIDTRTKAIVREGMDALMEGRTMFVIAHRLSTVQNANVIMVLEHGRIIKRGSHDRLVAERGKYYQLCTDAFELE